MAKLTLKASGGLNSDVDLNNLPDGDYLSASNIILEAGKNGGAGSVKLIESIDAISGLSITGTIKATFQNTDGKIYILTKIDSSEAAIYYIPSTLDSVNIVVKYNHSNVSDSLIPDLRVLGNTLVWNYAKEGEVLSFDLTRTYSSTAVNLTDLTLIKQTPNNVVSITKNINASTALSLLETNDYQFVFRYKYDSGEYSAISNISQMYYAEENVASYTFVYDFSSAPTYATEIEAYARVGNNGTWRRIDTVDDNGSSVTRTWTGDNFEALDTLTASKPFDAVPISAKHVEVAKNRIFLANVQDEYSEDGNISITVASGNGYTLSSGGVVSYFNSGGVTAPSSTETGNSYVKPFANNSSYAIGVALYDSALRTRGVESFTRFETGRFGAKVVPDITLSSSALPTWASFAQVVYTENLTKSYIYEGYASNIFFELLKKETDRETGEVVENRIIRQSIVNDDLRDVESLVLDLMGMFNAGYFYTFNQGDRVTLSLDNGTILDLEISGLQGTFLYCRYTGGEVSNPGVPDPSKLYFEIYTPKALVEDEELVFYEYGSLMPVTGGSALSKTLTATGNLNDTKLLGDMVWNSFQMPKYAEAPFSYSVAKDEYGTPASYTLLAYNNIANIVQLYSQLNYSSADGIGILRFDGVTKDGVALSGAIDGYELKMPDYFFAEDQNSVTGKIEITYNLRRTGSISIPSINPGQSYYFEYILSAQVYRRPYDNIKGEYGTAIKYGNRVDLLTEQYADFQISSTGTTTLTGYDFTNENEPQTIYLSKQGDIMANDKFYIEFTIRIVGHQNINFANIIFSKNSTKTNAVEFKLTGLSYPSKEISTYNTDADLETTQDTYLVRSISNGLVYKGWNKSKGKPSVLRTPTVSIYRTNSIRYSGPFVAGTKINNLNSFYALDSNDVPIENGQINSLQRVSRLQGSGDMLLALCERESSYIFLGEQDVSQSNNMSIRALVQNMIGTIRNLGDGLGLSDKQSLVNYKGTIYWWDNYNKKICEFNTQGISVISDYYMQSAFLSSSGIASMCYDPYYEMLYVSIGSETTSRGYSVISKRWRANYDFTVDFAESYGERMIVFKNNAVYKSLGNTYSNYYGTNYNGSITYLLNTGTPVLPLNVSISHNGNFVDYNQSNGVKTNTISIQVNNEKGQTSNIVESNFLMEDNLLYAHILRDTSNGGDLLEGDYIVGYLNKFIVSLKDNSQQMNIDRLNIEVEKVSGH